MEFKKSNFYNVPNYFVAFSLILIIFLIHGEYRWGLNPNLLYFPPLIFFCLVNFSDWFWNLHRPNMYQASQHKDYGDLIYYMGFLTSIASLGYALHEFSSLGGSDFNKVMYRFGTGLLVTGSCILGRFITIETAERNEEDHEQREASAKANVSTSELLRSEIDARNEFISNLKFSSEEFKKTSDDFKHNGQKVQDAVGSTYTDLSLMASSYKTSLEALKRESDNILKKMHANIDSPSNFINNLQDAGEKIKDLTKHIEAFNSSLKHISKNREDLSRSPQFPQTDIEGKVGGDGTSIDSIAFVIIGLLILYLLLKAVFNSW